MRGLRTQLHEEFQGQFITIKYKTQSNDEIKYYNCKLEGKEKDLTCRKLLPTASGCFFGSTAYDDWYFNGLKYTLERFESLLKYTKEVSDPAKWDSPKKIKRVIYEASW